MSDDAAFGNWLAGFIDGEGCFEEINKTLARWQKEIEKAMR